MTIVHSLKLMHFAWSIRQGKTVVIFISDAIFIFCFCKTASVVLPTGINWRCNRTKAFVWPRFMVNNFRTPLHEQ